MRPPRRIRRRAWHHDRASVSLEFALVSVFFLLPLLLICWDGMVLCAERYQVNADLHDLYYFAWSNPNQASSFDAVNNVLTALNQNAISEVVQYWGYWPHLSYACLQSNGSTTSANQNNDGTYSCSSGTLETMVTYKLSAYLNLPVPMPGFGNEVTINAGGTVRIK